MNDTLIWLVKIIYAVWIILYASLYKIGIKNDEEIDNSVIMSGVMMLAFGIFILMIKDY